MLGRRLALGLALAAIAMPVSARADVRTAGNVYYDVNHNNAYNPLFDVGIQGVQVGNYTTGGDATLAPVITDGGGFYDQTVTGVDTLSTRIKDARLSQVVDPVSPADGKTDGPGADPAS